MAVHYDDVMLRIAFRSDHEDNLEPTAEELADYDETLFKRFDKQLTKQADNAGIPSDSFSRSLLLVCAVLSTQDTPKPKVQDAVEYFLNVF